MSDYFIDNNTSFKELFKTLLSNSLDEDFLFFLNNFSSRLESVYDFYKSDKKILAVCGFQASGKSELLSTSTYFLKNDVLKIQFDCPESLVLDDIFLFIHSAIKEMALKGLVHIKKNNVVDFFELVKSALKQIDKPLVFIFNSFENCLAQNIRHDVINFLKYLSSLDNVKILLTARHLDLDDFIFSNLSIEKIVSQALSQDAVNEYFKLHEQECSDKALQTFYECSRGYLGYVKMTISLLNIYSVSLNEFLDEFKNKNLTFDKFLLQKSFGLATDNLKNILIFLSVIRINCPINFLLKYNLAKQDEIEYLCKKNLIITFKNFLYVKDFVKKFILKDAKLFAQYKIHKFLIDFFESQLPLKPVDRVVLISRATMRNEIKYHSIFINDNKIDEVSKSKKNPLPLSINNAGIPYNKPKNDKKNINLLENISNIKLQNIDEKKDENENNSIKSYSGNTYILNKDSIDVFNSIERAIEDKLLNKIQNDLNSVVFDLDTTENNTLISEEIYNNLPDVKKQINLKIKFLKLAQNAENAKEYKQANSFYLEALSQEEYKDKIPFIKTKIAINEQKMKNIDSAISYFNDAYRLYLDSNDIVKANYILLYIANLYKENFMFNKAKNLYYEILSDKRNLPLLLNVYSYFGLAEIENSNNNLIGAYKLYNELLPLLKDINDVVLKCEIYFKCGLLNDDMNNLDNALNYYNYSISLSDDVTINANLGACYSNIASIYQERNDKNKAMEYFIKALDVDKKQDNLDGQYFCYINMADVNSRKNRDLAKEYFDKAINIAKKMNDAFYLAEAHLKYGDFYYNCSNNELALKHYLIAKNNIKYDVTEINFQKIDIRLNDLKIRMGVNIYSKKLMELNNEIKSN